MKNFSLKTKENYLHSSKGAYLGKNLLWIFIAFVILYSGHNILGNIASFITTPIYFARHYLETSSATIPVFIRSRLELDEKIRNLETEIAIQKGTDATYAYMTKENEELRKLLHASSSPDIVAGVIARPPHSPYDTFIIDRGTDDGITEDAPVYYGTRRAVGYVHRTFAKTSLVTLFSSPGVESTVYIYGPNIFTTAYGEGGGVIRLSVPQGIILEKGNPVILPALDTGVLGVIDDIQSIPSEPEQHAYVTFDVPLQSIRLVSVGTTPIHPALYSEAVERVREEKTNLFTFEVPQDEVPAVGEETRAPVPTSTQSISSTTGGVSIPAQ